MKKVSENRDHLSSPFGLEMGLSEEEVRERCPDLRLGDEPLDPYEYWARKIPKPVSLFVDYHFCITPKNGLCMLTAIGPSVPWQEALDDYLDFESTLREKYGGDFATIEEMIVQGQSPYRHRMWKRADGKSQLPADIETIDLGLIKDVQLSDESDEDLRYVQLSYHFANFEAGFDETIEKGGALQAQRRRKRIDRDAL